MSVYIVSGIAERVALHLYKLSLLSGSAAIENLFLIEISFLTLAQLLANQRKKIDC